MHLAQLPHRCLTRPVKVFDFDFCAPAGTPYPTEAALQLEVVAGGRLNGVAVWFDLHLAEGVATTSGEAGSLCACHNNSVHCDTHHQSCSVHLQLQTSVMLIQDRVLHHQSLLWSMVSCCRTNAVQQQVQHTCCKHYTLYAVYGRLLPAECCCTVHAAVHSSGHAEREITHACALVR